MILYFSGTGNSQYVAEALADRLQDGAISANQYIKDHIRGQFESVQPWVFVFPVYIATIGETFANFLKQASFAGDRRAYFVATCASDNGIAPRVCADICKAQGLTYMGSEKVVMPQDYIAFFTMCTPEEAADRQQNALVACDAISEVIRKGETLNMDRKPWITRDAILLTEKLYNRGFTRTKPFHTTDKCVGCGMCSRICPTNHITMVDGRPKWTGTCIHCMACINRCPMAAIEYGKKTLTKPRYVCKRYRKKDAQG